MKLFLFPRRPILWSFLALLFCFSIPVSADKTSPQEIHLTGTKQVKSLKDLIQQIEGSSSYRFSYVKGLIDNISVHINEKKGAIEEILNEALDGTGLTYVIKSNDIILVKTTPQPKMQANPTLKIVKGTVLDAQQTNQSLVLKSG